GDGAVGTHSFFYGLWRKVAVVEAEKPAYAGFFKLQKTGGFVWTVLVNNVLFHIAKNPGNHIEKMDANVGGHSSRLGNITLPAFQIPFSTGSDVAQIDVVYFIAAFVYFLF